MVKASQPNLLEQLERHAWLEPAVPCSDGGRGRIETRRWQRTDAIAQDLPPPWLDLPGGARCAARITSETMCKQDSSEGDMGIAYLNTNLPPGRPAAATLLALSRGYGGAVENGMHGMRAVVLGADASRIRSEMLPRVMAASARLALSIQRLLRVRNVQRMMKQLLH